MPPPPHKEQEERNKKVQLQDPSKAILLAKVSLTTLRPIEKAMNDAEKQKTGLHKLHAEELVNLNEWLNSNAVLAPGDQPHRPG